MSRIVVLPELIAVLVAAPLSFAAQRLVYRWRGTRVPIQPAVIAVAGALWVVLLAVAASASHALGTSRLDFVVVAVVVAIAVIAGSVFNAFRFTADEGHFVKIAVGLRAEVEPLYLRLRPYLAEEYTVMVDLLLKHADRALDARLGTDAVTFVTEAAQELNRGLHCGPGRGSGAPSDADVAAVQELLRRAAYAPASYAATVPRSPE